MAGFGWPPRALQAAYNLLPSPDGNFIKDFQSTGFDARIWELYLVSLFNSLGLTVEQPFDRPDFYLKGAARPVWVEATTSNPTDGERVSPPDGYWDKQDHIAIKLGSPLYSKLTKRYWDLDHVSGQPLIFAVAAFHDSSPLRPASDPLQRYLYGQHVTLKSEPGQDVVWGMDEIRTLGPKKVPAGFFSLPDAKYVSAVLFSNAGTVAKFSRMGFNRWIHPYVKMVRLGHCYSNDPKSMTGEPFAYIVGDAPEIWGQEAMILHNPNALYPITEDCFPSIAQTWFEKGKLRTKLPDFYPLISTTHTVCGLPQRMEALEPKLRERAREWVLNTLEKTPDFERDIAAFHKEWGSEPNETPE